MANRMPLSRTLSPMHSFNDENPMMRASPMHEAWRGDDAEHEVPVKSRRGRGAAPALCCACACALVVVLVGAYLFARGVPFA